MELAISASVSGQQVSRSVSLSLYRSHFCSLSLSLFLCVSLSVTFSHTFHTHTQTIPLSSLLRAKHNIADVFPLSHIYPLKSSDPNDVLMSDSR